MLVAVAQLKLRQGRRQAFGHLADTETSPAQLQQKWAQARPDTSFSGKEYIIVYKKMAKSFLPSYNAVAVLPCSVRNYRVTEKTGSNQRKKYIKKVDLKIIYFYDISFYKPQKSFYKCKRTWTMPKTRRHCQWQHYDRNDKSWKVSGILWYPLSDLVTAQKIKIIQETTG